MTLGNQQHTTLHRFSQRALVVLVCLSLGMHWTLLQGIAWTGMLLSYAGEGTMIEAVTKTFDGEHPCPLCLAVKEGQKDEKNDPAGGPAKSLKKFEAVLVAQIRLVAPPALERHFLPLISRFEPRRGETPLPPPRERIA